MSSGEVAAAVPADVVPVLTDGVVTLRGHREEDLDAIVEQAWDPLMALFTTVPQPYARSDAEAFLAAVHSAWADPLGHRSWAIEVPDGHGTPRFAGSIDYRPEPGGAADIGFGLHPWARERGLMARALRVLLRHVFESGVEVAHWRAHVGNWASRRTAWACGFRVEGTVTSLLGARGQRHDGWIGSLRRGDPMTPPHPWHVPAVLEGDTVRLRPWREQDRPRPDQVPDAASLRFMPAGAQPGPEDFDAWLTTRRARMATGESVTWCIADAADDAPLGMLSLFRMEVAMLRGSAEVGYWLHETARGRGAMREALDLVVEHAFTSTGDGGLGLHRLAAGTDVDNRASELVLRRSAFSRVGVEHQALAHVDEAPTDGPLWELLAGTDRTAVRAARIELPVLPGDTVRLRPWRVTDAPRIVEACSDEVTRHFLRTLPSPYTQADALTYIRRMADALWDGASACWCMADVDSDECVGSIAVFDMNGLNPTSGEIGYWLHPAARGRGVMTEAVRLVAVHAFTARRKGGLGRLRLELLAAATNSSSQAIARRCGFVEVGRDRQGELLGDATVVDLVRFDLLRKEYRSALKAARPRRDRATPPG